MWSKDTLHIRIEQCSSCHFCASKCKEAQLCVFRMQNDNQQGMLAKTVASCEAGYLRIVINFPKLNRLPILKVLCILATSKIDQD